MNIVLRKKKGFTCLEAIVSIIIISSVFIYFLKQSNVTYQHLNKINTMNNNYMQEYQDIETLRTSTSKPELNNTEYLSLVDSGTGFELWCYTGEYFKIYKMCEG